MVENATISSSHNTGQSIAPCSLSLAQRPVWNLLTVDGSEVLMHLTLYRHGVVVTLCVPRLCCNFMTEKDKIKSGWIIKTCWRTKYEADWHNYWEECARWATSLIHCRVQTLSNGRRPKFHLILRCSNRCDPEWAPTGPYTIQLCAEVRTQLIFSHGYYNAN